MPSFLRKEPIPGFHLTDRKKQRRIWRPSPALLFRVANSKSLRSGLVISCRFKLVSTTPQEASIHTGEPLAKQCVISRLFLPPSGIKSSGDAGGDAAAPADTYENQPFDEAVALTDESSISDQSDGEANADGGAAIEHC